MVIGYAAAIYTLIRVFITAASFSSAVPFVPSSRLSLHKLFELLEVNSGDKIVDIGSGSGTLICGLAKEFPEAQFTGIEINPLLVKISNIRKILLRLRNVQFVVADALEYDFHQFNKVCLYMTSEFIEILMPVLEDQLPQGGMIVSIAFDFGEKFMKVHESEISVYNIDSSKVINRFYLWNKK